MDLKYIITSRDYNNWPSWDLVYEWEDAIRQYLEIDYIYNKRIRYNRFVRRLSFLSSMLITNKNSLLFEMNSKRIGHGDNKNNIVPWIIDFFDRNQKDLHSFYEHYNNHCLVLISSKEAFEFLRSANCPLNINHLPLSIPDIYKIKSSSRFEKKYDLVMMGRQNPVLEGWAKEYSQKHPAFYYVYRILKDGKFNYFTSRGEHLGDINTRGGYISLMRQARVGLYSTPGIDGGETRTNGFNQVTPRFLELIACGCHVIARYTNNPDTDYFGLNKFCPNISSYKEFESRLDDVLDKDVDMHSYSEYLSRHYTSQRCEELKNILYQI